MEQHPDDSRPEGAPAAEADEAFDPANLPLPWEAPDPDGAPDPEEDPDAPRQRHDAFTPRRKNAFLRALQKTGCVADAAREVGVSPRTVYNHQGNDAEFLEQCVLAVSMCEVPLEIAAWKRGVTGVEEQVAVGGRMITRIKRSDSILRLLLQGSNPKKYGPRPGFTRKRLLKHERKEIELEVRAKFEARHSPPAMEQVTASIIRKVEAIKRHSDAEKLAAGWTQAEDGYMIPPGYGPIAPPEGVAQSTQGAAQGDPPGDSM